MNNDLLNKITAWEPRAVWTEGGDGMFTVPADGFHDLAGRLRADGFDFLRSLTGMDWGEAGFGVCYGDGSKWRIFVGFCLVFDCYGNICVL